MKTLLSILVLLLLVVGAQAQITTATIAVTNAAGTTNGQTIVINGVTRTWTNSVFIPSVQILTNATPTGAATNLYNQLGGAPIAGGVTVTYGSSTSAVLRSFPAQTLTVTLSAGWGTVTYGTNPTTGRYTVTVPGAMEPNVVQTNLSSGIVAWVNNTFATNQLAQSQPAMAQLVGLTNAQTISGNKAFTASNNVVTETVGTFIATTSGTISNLVAVDGYNLGAAFSSFGAGANSEQFGADAAAAGDFGIAVGNNATASGENSSAFGYLSSATGQAAAALGNEATADGVGALAVGVQAVANADSSTALGSTATVDATHTNSVALGSAATTTKKNQIMLGSSGHVVTIPGSLEHLKTTGTNSFSDIAFRRYAITSLANGNNAGVIVGTNTFVQVSGPSGAFTINGLTGSPSRDGHVVKILNRTGQNMTIANDSGTDPVAANRIYTLTGADVGPSTGDCIATFIYSLADSRWILDSYSP